MNNQKQFAQAIRDFVNAAGGMLKSRADEKEAHALHPVNPGRPPHDVEDVFAEIGREKQQAAEEMAKHGEQAMQLAFAPPFAIGDLNPDQWLSWLKTTITDTMAILVARLNNRIMPTGPVANEAKAHALMEQLNALPNQIDNWPAPKGQDNLITVERFAEISGLDKKHVKRESDAGRLPLTDAEARRRKQRNEGKAKIEIRMNKTAQSQKTVRAKRRCTSPTCTWIGNLPPEQIECPECGGRTKLAV